MRLRGKKPIFSYRDTFSLDHVLATVICAGVKKFRDVLQEKHGKNSTMGVPIIVPELKSINYSEHGVNMDVYCVDEMKDGNVSEEYLAKNVELWLMVLDDLIYAYGNYDIDIPYEGLKYTWVESATGEALESVMDIKPNVPYDIIPNDEKLREDYLNRQREHWRKIELGIKLFGMFFRNLWW